MSPYNDQERVMVAVNALVTLFGLASLTLHSDYPTQTNDEINWKIGALLTGVMGCLALIFLAPALNLEISSLVCTIVLGLSSLGLLITYRLRDSWGPWAPFNAIFVIIAANAFGLLLLEVFRH